MYIGEGCYGDFGILMYRFWLHMYVTRKLAPYYLQCSDVPLWMCVLPGVCKKKHLMGYVKSKMFIVFW
jgi:hypothetical protein